MALNDGRTSKQRAREELRRLVEEYEARGGEISRNIRCKVFIICKLCGNRSYHDFGHAVQFKPRCRKCGGGMLISA